MQYRSGIQVLYTSNWVIIYHQPPATKGTRNSYWKVQKTRLSANPVTLKTRTTIGLCIHHFRLKANIWTTHWQDMHEMLPVKASVNGSCSYASWLRWHLNGTQSEPTYCKQCFLQGADGPVLMRSNSLSKARVTTHDFLEYALHSRLNCILGSLAHDGGEQATIGNHHPRFKKKAHVLIQNISLLCLNYSKMQAHICKNVRFVPSIPPDWNTTNIHNFYGEAWQLCWPLVVHLAPSSRLRRGLSWHWRRQDLSQNAHWYLG